MDSLGLCWHLLKEESAIALQPLLHMIFLVLAKNSSRSEILGISNVPKAIENAKAFALELIHYLVDISSAVHWP